MTRTNDRLTAIEDALKRIEERVDGLTSSLARHGTAIHAEVKAARSSAEAARGSVQALAAVVTKPAQAPADTETAAEPAPRPRHAGRTATTTPKEDM